MIDRLAALADIVPPMPVAPPPPLPWWQGALGVILLVVLALLLCAGGLAWWQSRKQRRALRQLRRLARLGSNAAVQGAAAAGMPDISAQMSAALACARQGGVDLQRLPQAWQRRTDALRYAANPDASAWHGVMAVLVQALQQRAWQRARFWRARPPGNLAECVLQANGAAAHSGSVAKAADPSARRAGVDTAGPGNARAAVHANSHPTSHSTSAASAPEQEL